MLYHCITLRHYYITLTYYYIITLHVRQLSLLCHLATDNTLYNSV